MTDPTLEKAERLLDVGRPAEAVALLEAAGVPDVGSPAAAATLAGARFEAGDWYGALYAADRSLAQLPDQEFPLRIRALALSKLGHHREALAAIRRAIRLHPGGWRTHQAHAHVLYGAEDFRAAQRAVEPAIELVPQEPGPHSIAGSIALRLGDLARARQHFETSLRLDPNQTRVINALGAVAMKEGDLESAREHFVDAARTAPNPSAVRNVELVEDQQFRQAHPHRVRWRARLRRLRDRPSRFVPLAVLAVGLLVGLGLTVAGAPDAGAVAVLLGVVSAAVAARIVLGWDGSGRPKPIRRSARS